jgi:hypothetical protein
MGIHEASAVPDWCGGNCGRPTYARHQSKSAWYQPAPCSLLRGPGAGDRLGFHRAQLRILDPGDYFTPGNSSALGLIQSLGENGVIRIGGNTSERTLWGADTKPAGPAGFVIRPANIDRLAAALRVLGWELIYGLNLARGSPAEAADEAAYWRTSWAQICWPSRSEMNLTDLVAGPQCAPPATTSTRIWRSGARFTRRFARECPALCSPDPTFPARLIGLPHSRKRCRRGWCC